MSEIVTMAEAIDIAIAAERRLSRQVFIAKDGSGIDFKIGLAIYDVPKQLCSTPEQIISWCVHLAPKRWIKKRHLVRFVELAYHLNGLGEPRR